MRTMEEYYDMVVANRALAADPKVLACTCPNTLCDWHGKCRECVALHRHYGDHLPVCLQPLIHDKIQALAGVAERTTAAKEATPIEYRRYVRERDNQAKNTASTTHKE